MKRKNKWSMILCLVPFLILIIAFEIVPFITIIINSFKTESGMWTLTQYKTALTNKFYIQGITNSLKISLYSSAIGVLVAVIGAYSISNLSSKIKEKVLILSNMTSNFAGVPLAFAFMILLGNNGIVAILAKKMGWEILSKFDLYSSLGLTVVYIYFQIPLGILLMYPAYDAIKEEWKEAAKIFGASKFGFWRYIGIPIIAPSILGTFSILFANAMGAYATVVALTSGNLNLLPVRIGALISGDIFLNPELAGALAVILSIIIIFTNLINNAMVRRRWEGR